VSLVSRRSLGAGATARPALVEVGILAFALAVGGCAGFQAKPIGPRDVLREL